MTTKTNPTDNEIESEFYTLKDQIKKEHSDKGDWICDDYAYRQAAIRLVRHYLEERKPARSKEFLEYLRYGKRATYEQVEAKYLATHSDKTEGAEANGALVSDSARQRKDEERNGAANPDYPANSAPSSPYEEIRMEHFEDYWEKSLKNLPTTATRICQLMHDYSQGGGGIHDVRDCPDTTEREGQWLNKITEVEMIINRGKKPRAFSEEDVEKVACLLYITAHPKNGYGRETTREDWESNRMNSKDERQQKYKDLARSLLSSCGFKPLNEAIAEFLESEEAEERAITIYQLIQSSRHADMTRYAAARGMLKDVLFNMATKLRQEKEARK